MDGAVVSDEAIVTYSESDFIGRIRISRPERRNALNHNAVEELRGAVAQAAEDRVRVLVVSGDAGHFCAGADLKELEDLAFTEALRVALDDLAGMRVPTMAAISGSCMGLGVQIALACDLRISTDDAKFAVPVAKLGLMVDHWTVARLAHCAGQSMARWMMLTAEPITAARAAEVGLVQHVVEDSGSAGGEPDDADSTVTVDRAAITLATKISTLAPMALAGTKLGLNQLEWQIPDDGQYRSAFEAAWGSRDLIEGRQAFADRRKPEFRGE